MDGERWRRIEQIFHQALDQSESVRTAFLDAACAEDADLRHEVELLLRGDQIAGARIEGAVRDAIGELEPRAFTGNRIGPYQIVDLIGEGGMGSVYRARRSDGVFDKDCAIKIVKRGMDSRAIVRRFQDERRILASLEHPFIARVLDGGSTDDGLPYLVMEYVEGRPLTDYCDELHLSLRERLVLFQKVCDAADHAHRNLVVHRDLKPSNILVIGDGVPKLLDFGIAKVLAGDEEPQRTLTGDWKAFTPQYCSPEQVRGEAVAIATDVYSLGAILYELLSGARAHRLESNSPLAVEEAVCRAEPALPSAAATDAPTARRLRGDLDNIILRAMQKDRARRYLSAAALADDIRCYLADLPVQARPDAALYRAAKFVKRHRILLAAAAAVFVATTGAGLVALRQAQIARAREIQIRGLARVFLFDVHDAVRDLPGATKARQTIVDYAVRYLDTLAQSGAPEPELARELAAGYMRVGDIQGGVDETANVGALTEALATYRKALTYLDIVLASSPGDRSATLDRLLLLGRIADKEARTAGPAASIATYARAIDEGRQAVRQFPSDRPIRRWFGETLADATRWRRDTGDYVGSLATATEGVAVFDELLHQSPDDEDLWGAMAAAQTAVGSIQAARGDLRIALASYERAVDLGEKLVARQPLSVNHRRNLMLAYSHVGDVLGFPGLRNLGDVEGSTRAFDKMVALARQLHEADPDDARAAADHAIALMRAGTVMPITRVAEKQQLLEGALAATEALLATSPRDFLLQTNAAYLAIQLGHLHRDTSSWAAASTYYRRAMRVVEPLVGDRNLSPASTFVVASGQLAQVEARLGHRTEAMRLAYSAIGVAQKMFDGHDDPDVLGPRYLLPRAYGNLAGTYALLGDAAKAAESRARALALWKQLEHTRGFTEQFLQEMRALEPR